MAGALETIGPFAGWQAAQEDTRANTAQNIQNDLEKMQSIHAGAMAQDSMAQANLRNIQVEQQRLFMNRQRERMAATTTAAKSRAGQASLQQQALGQPTPGTIPEELLQEQFSEIEDLQAAGMYKDASTELAKMSAALKNQSGIFRDTHGAAKVDAETDMLHASFMASITPTVKDEQSWRAAMMQYQAVFGEPVPPQLQQLHYSPELVQRLSAAGIKAKDAAALKLREEHEKAYADSQKAYRDHLKFGESFSNIEKRSAATRAGQLRAAGETSLEPTGKDVARIARSMVVNDFANIDTAVADIKARELITRARELMAKNPALKGYEAEAKAWADMKKSDEYLKEESKKMNGVAPEYPVPYKDGTKLEDGKYYKLDDGKTYQYESSMFGKGKMKEVDVPKPTSSDEDYSATDSETGEVVYPPPEEPEPSDRDLSEDAP